MQRVQLLPETSDPHTWELQWKGVPVCYVNAVRRILMSHIETMAIEHVKIIKNTSYIPDEMLVHRLAMTGIRVNASLFETYMEDNPDPSRNQLVFALQAIHSNGGNSFAKKTIYAGDLIWKPLGSFQERLPEKPTIIHPRIPLVCLAPGQEIQLECVCVKSTAQEHAKWSAVDHVYYRFADDSSDHIIMHLESRGIYSNKELLVKTLGQLKDRLNNLQRELEL